VNLRGFDPAAQPVGAAEAVRGFLDALGLPPERIPVGAEAQAALYRSLLADRRMLVVLDNARDADQVRLLLPGSPRSLTLITSRIQLESLVAVEAAQPVPIGLLSPMEAYELLAGRIGKRRLAAEPEAADAIISACARLPLALAIFAARAAFHPHFPLAALVTELETTRTGLEPFNSCDTAVDLRTVFSWSYVQLDANAQRLFRFLSLHPGPDVTAPAAASLTGQSLALVRGRLADLCRAHLLTEHAPGRYTFHDLLRAYATELADTHESDAERRTAVHRMLDHYLHIACAADRLLHPARDLLGLTPPRLGVTHEPLEDYDQAMAWLADEYAVLLGCVNQAAAIGFDVHAWQLVWVLETFLIWRGLRQDRAAAAMTALNATVRLGDKAGQARTHRLLALAELDIGRIDVADTHLRDALELSSELGDLVGQAHSQSYLGRVCERQNRYADALDHAQQSLILHRSAGHRRGEANALTAVGWCHAHLGHYQQALETCAQALAIQEELDNRPGQADNWDSLGYVHYRFGHPADAIACYQQATDLYREVGNRHEEAETLVNLGEAIHATGDHETTLGTWQEALTILEELDHPAAATVHAKLAKLTDTAP
jgi:tetratricopeptide (TPR) repeat protein